MFVSEEEWILFVNMARFEREMTARSPKNHQGSTFHFSSSELRPQRKEKKRKSHSYSQQVLTPSLWIIYKHQQNEMMVVSSPKSDDMSDDTIGKAEFHFRNMITLYTSSSPLKLTHVFHSRLHFPTSGNSFLHQLLVSLAGINSRFKASRGSERGKHVRVKEKGCRKSDTSCSGVEKERSYIYFPSLDVTK